MMSTIVHHDHRSPWLRFWSLLRTKLTRFLSNQSTRSSFLQHFKFDGLFSNSAVYLIFPTIKLNPSARRHWREAEGLTTPCPAEVIHRSHQQSCKDQHPDNNACYRAGAHLGFFVSCSKERKGKKFASHIRELTTECQKMLTMKEHISCAIIRGYRCEFVLTTGLL